MIVPLETIRAPGRSLLLRKNQQEEILTSTAEVRDPLCDRQARTCYGPGNEKIAGRVGMDSFGFHAFGRLNTIPFTYVENARTRRFGWTQERIEVKFQRRG